MSNENGSGDYPKVISDEKFIDNKKGSGKDVLMSVKDDFSSVSELIEVDPIEAGLSYLDRRSQSHKNVEALFGLAGVSYGIGLMMFSDYIGGDFQRVFQFPAFVLAIASLTVLSLSGKENPNEALLRLEQRAAIEQELNNEI